MTALQTRAAPAARPPASPAPDAIALLSADHEAVDRLFDAYESTRSVDDKMALVAEICLALRLHAQIEEEIFYPAVKDALKDRRLVPEAAVEHAGVRGLIAQLEGVRPGSEVYDARVRVLSQYVRHHVQVEQDSMFPRARASSLDLEELGARMAARQQDLLERQT